MPLRLYRHSLAVLLLAAVSPAGAGDLNWITAGEMADLPPEQQQPVPAWCPGIYYNPAFATPPDSRDTVITADTSSLMPDGLAELIGDVRIEQPNRLLFAERAHFNQETGDFELSGGIRVETPELTFNAERMSGNHNNRVAVLDDAEYAFFNPGARGHAVRIEQQSELIHINSGAYTTCEPGNNGWLLRARWMELNREEGWGEARHVTLNVKDVPVLWVPWITFPIDDRRKSGLLFPDIASADNGGVDITQPLYLNLHPQMDATLAPRHIHGRGNGLESEFRYLTPLGEGSFSHAWLNNDREFNDQDRELARWHHDGQVGNWNLAADLNYVSDDFYFKDLDTGLEVNARTHLPRKGHVRYRGRTWQAMLRAQSWQTIDPNLPDASLPYRRLPQLALRGDPTLAGPLQARWLSDVTRFDHPKAEKAALFTGDRLHLEPALTLPLEKPWGYIEPRVRLYHTRYNLEETGTPPEQDPERTLGGASLDSGLFLERPLFDGHWRQTLEPRLFLNKVEYQAQDQLPKFDTARLTFSWHNLFRENRFTGYDRIGDEEKLAVGLTSRFINNDTGAERLRLRAGQGFFREDRRVTLNGIPNRREQTPLVADAQWQVNDRWHARGEVQWDTEINQRERTSLSAGYNAGPRRQLHLGFHDRPALPARPALRQGELGGLWPVLPQWSLFGRWFYDLDNHRSLETLGGVDYRDCCWNIRLLGHRELSDDNGDTVLEAESTVMLQIRLIGLGGFGGRVDSLLERSLPRYEAP